MPMFQSLPRRFTLAAVLLGVIFCGSCGSCSSIIRNSLTIATFTPQKNNAEPIWQDFYWSGSEFLSTYNPKVSLFLPVKIKGTDAPVAMQLDFGSSTSFLYYRTLQTVQYSGSLDTAKSTALKVTLSVGNSTNLAETMRFRRTLGGTELVQGHYKLGTLGYDYFAGKVMIIDFANNRFLLADSLPSLYSQGATMIQGASVNKFPILIPAKLNEKEINLMWDTGSSLFSFLVTPARFNELRMIHNSTNSSIDTLCCVQAFGKSYPVMQTTLLGRMDFLGKTYLEPHISTTIRFNESPEVDLGMTFMGMSGITGNVLFENMLVIIDFNRNTLAIKQ